MPPSFRIGGTGFGGSCRKIVEAPQGFWVSRHGRAAIVAGFLTAKVRRSRLQSLSEDT